jgi:transcription elongation factor GreB
LIKAREGDVVKLATPVGVQEVEVLRVQYPQASQ